MLLLALFACAEPNSCEDYVDAAVACSQSAGADPTPYDEDVLCGGWTEAAEATYGGWYACQAKAFEDADCGSSEGWQAGADAAAECALP